jgi:hypothetical protein
LAPGGLLADAASTAAAAVAYRYHPAVGTTFGLFGGSSAVPLLPGDQRQEDAWSANWTSAPLGDALEILGNGSVALRVAVSAPVATVVARLLDVAPNGEAALVTKGVLNLTHRASHADPTPVPVDEAIDVEVPLEATSWRFDPGHAICVAITGADYPLLWPSPYPYDGRIFVGGDAPTALTLPVVPPADAPLPVPVLGEPPAVRELPGFALDVPSWRVTRDHSRGVVEVELHTNNATRLPDGSRYHASSHATTRVREDDPAVAGIVGLSTLALEAPDRTVQAQSRGEIRSDASAFHVTVHLEVTVDGTTYHERRWARSFPRRLL